MKKIIISDANVQHQKLYQKYLLPFSAHAEVIAWTTSFIDTKEKTSEYVPDFLFMDMDFKDGTALDILSLCKNQQLSTTCYIISEDISYVNVRNAFLHGVTDYIVYSELSIALFKRIFDQQSIEIPDNKKVLLDDQIQQYLGLLKDKQDINFQNLYDLLIQSKVDFTNTMQLVHFRIDRIHKVYAQGMNDRILFRNQLCKIINEQFKPVHTIFFSKNHSGVILFDPVTIHKYDPLLRAIMDDLYKQFQYTITFIYSPSFIGVDEFLKEYTYIANKQDSKFYQIPGSILSAIPMFEKLQTINAMYQKKRFSSFQNLTLENLHSFLESTISFFKTNRIEPIDIRDFYCYTMTKINVITQEHGLDNQFPFDDYILQIHFCEYIGDLQSLLYDCFEKMYHWMQSSSNRYSLNINTVITLVEEHPDQHFTLQDIANLLKISTVHLSRSFKKETGITLFDFINATKMKKACELLTTTQWRVLDISNFLGYQNQFYFSKVFQRYYHVSPIEYRKHKDI